MWVQRLLQNPAEWPLLDLDGHAAVFGWRDPEKRGSRDLFAGQSIDLKVVAFQDPKEYPRAAAYRAPRRWPGREPAASGWVDAIIKAPKPRSPKSDEAALYLVRYEDDAPRFSYRAKLAWSESLFAGAVGTGCCANGSVVAPYETALRLNILTAGPAAPPPPGESPTPAEKLAYFIQEDYDARRPQGPDGLLYLALRAARQAVHDNPDDAQAYLILGKTYRRILQNSPERTWNPPAAFWNRQAAPRPPTFKLLYRVRTAEAVTAYKHALTVNPDMAEAHMDLIFLYQDMNYQDEVLAELKEVLRCERKAGPREGESRPAYAARLADLEDLVGRKEKDIAEQLDRFEVRSAGMPPYNKAETAWLEYGLAGKALSILLSSEVAAFGREGMALELELLLHTGRVKEVREWPDPEGARDFLGAIPYLEIKVQLEAASGNYQQADEDLAELAAVFQTVTDPAGDRLTVRGEIAVAATRAILFAQPFDGFPPVLTRTTFTYPSIMEEMAAVAGNMPREADLTTLRGLLALECGQTDQARGEIHHALSLWGNEAMAAGGGGINFPARGIAQDAEKLLDSAVDRR